MATLTLAEQINNLVQGNAQLKSALQGSRSVDEAVSLLVSAAQAGGIAVTADTLRAALVPSAEMSDADLDKVAGGIGINGCGTGGGLLTSGVMCQLANSAAWLGVGGCNGAGPLGSGGMPKLF